MTDATLLPDGDRAAVRVERQLADPPAVAWRSLTDPQELRGWFPCAVEVDGGGWQAGAALTFRFGPEAGDMVMTGRALTVDAPRALDFSWGEEVLRFTLARDDGGTRLVLVDELPRAFAARNAAGWDTCLDRLTGREVATDAWSSRFAAYSEAFTPTLGPQEGPPAEFRG
jgi:uncharacterized protein YndB with AHSA1/START domain